MNSVEWVDAISSATNHAESLETARRATMECPSVDVWVKYAEMLLVNGAPRLAVLQEGMDQVGLWLKSSHLLWHYYIDAVKQTTPESVTAAFLERLAVPHLTIDETFTDFSTYLSEEDNYEDTMLRATKIVEKTRRFLRERESWELATPVPLEAYLEWELGRFSASARFDFCAALFDRILTASPRKSAFLWVRFVRHMWFYHSAKAWSTAERALAYFPKDAQLWTLLVRIACQEGDRERVQLAVKKAKAADINMEKTPELLNTYCAWLANSQNSNPAAVRELRVLAEPTMFSPYVSVDQLASLALLLASVNETDIARKAWRKHAPSKCRNGEFWEAWVAFELAQGHKERLVGCERLWKMYTHYCRTEEHLFVRRHVQRVLTIANVPVEAEKIAVVGETTVWVSQVPVEWGEATVRSAFEVFGSVCGVRRPHSGNFCYVQFESHEAAFRAVATGVKGLHIELSQRPLKPQSVTPQLKRETARKRAHNHNENMLVFSGMCDEADVSHVRALLSKYGNTTVEETESELQVIFPSDRESGHAQLKLSGTELPSGKHLSASYA